MLKIFWDTDNIAFIGNQVNATEHSHCVIQLFLSLDNPLQLIVNGKQISGNCIMVNKNTRHIFSCDNKIRVSILIEPSSSFAKELIKKIDGDYLIYNNGLEHIQQKAALLLNTNDKRKYENFILI